MNIVYHHRTRSTDAQRIHILELARAFRELGHHVDIVSLVPTEHAKADATRDATDAAWQKIVRRIPFVYEFVQLAYNVVGVPMLARRLAASRVDCLYERYALFNFTGVIVARLFRKPIALEVNSPLALEQARDKHITAVRFAQWSERVICNLADRVVVVSTPLRQMMIDAGVQADKLLLSPNGVRQEAFTAGVASSELRSKFALTGRRVIGFVGWFRQWHGLEMLIDAFHAANLGARNATLLLVGDGPAMAELRDRVDRYRLSESVMFSGPLPHEEVPRYLDLIDVAVQPAANEYCCPMKLLEYMALGKAIVAPRQANILDLLDEGEAAFFTPGSADDLGRTLQNVLDDPARLSALKAASAAALRTHGYSWEANARSVLDALMSKPADAKDCSTVLTPSR